MTRSASSPAQAEALTATGLSLADEMQVIEKTLLNLAAIAEALGHKWTARQRATLNYSLAILGGDDADADDNGPE